MQEVSSVKTSLRLTNILTIDLRARTGTRCRTHDATLALLSVIEDTVRLKRLGEIIDSGCLFVSLQPALTC